MVDVHVKSDNLKLCTFDKCLENNDQVSVSSIHVHLLIIHCLHNIYDKTNKPCILNTPSLFI